MQVLSTKRIHEYSDSCINNINIHIMNTCRINNNITDIQCEYQNIGPSRSSDEQISFDVI